MGFQDVLYAAGRDQAAVTKRVYFEASDTVYEGMIVCYNSDTTTNVSGLTSGVTAEGSQNEGKYFYVEKEKSTNIKAFAGVVAKGSWCGTVGPCYLDINIPNGAIVPVRCQANIALDDDIYLVDASYVAGITPLANGYIGRAFETINRSSAAGLVLVRLHGSVDIVDSFVGNLVGDVTGDLTGDVTGDVTGNVTGNVTGSLAGATVIASTGVQSTATAVTATTGGATTGLIASNASIVVVTSDSADKQITLPAPIAGMRIKIIVGATGCELIATGSSVKINNVVCSATNEAALVATSIYEVICTSSTTWLMSGMTYLGAVETPVVPDTL